MIEAGKVVAILLAAGRSVRFGGNDKLLALFDGRPLILHAAERIGELNTAQKIAVCGSAEVGDILRPMGFRIIVNPDPEQGLSSSLALGIAAAGQGDAALVALADMPLVSPGHFGALLARFDADNAPVVASRSGDTPMPPAVFAGSLFDRLKSGRGDQGARALLSGADYVTAPADELADIDTYDDLRRITPSRAAGPDVCRA
ncbi:nucleotidyltransferase family protein [soil metagenome]